MKLGMILLIAVIVIAGLALVVAYALFCYTFCYVPGQRRDSRAVPDEPQYTDHREQIERQMLELDELGGERVSISSDDGLRLHATLFHANPGAPTIIFMHGYHASPYCDGYGCIRLCRECHYNMLLVEQRAHGDSACKVLTFGIRERLDCRAWADYLTERFGAQERIFLFGVSMGGATVTMAIETKLPAAVKGIIADCGYTSPKEIICNTAKSLDFPVGISYQLARLGALIYGGFRVEAASSMEAVKQSKVPLLFIHGDNDEFVPAPMCAELYEACTAPKECLYVKGAGHAVSSMVDYESYRDAVVSFIEKYS